MATPILLDEAGALDIVLRERRRWRRRFYHLVDDAVDIDGEPEPFDSGTTAYLTFRDEVDGTPLLQLGPSIEALDGIIEVDADAGIIEADVFVPEGLAFPGGLGVWELLLYPGGDPDEAHTLLVGTAHYERWIVQRPAVGES